MEEKIITILFGSPRKNGNSAALVEAFTEGAAEKGVEVMVFDLHNMDISPCSGCNSCQDDPESGCVIEDDMGVVYRQLTASDAVVFAGPVYCFSVSAQTKIAIDRMYAISGNRSNVMGGKTFAVILAYADDDPFVSGASNAVRTIQDFAAYIGAGIGGVVHGSAYEAGEIRNNDTVMEDARELGRKLASK